MQTGSCECGAVSYELEGPLREVVHCHCSQCRKTSGHYWAATNVPTEALKITKADRLKWFQSSEVARRAFCTECGSSLFYQFDGAGTTAIGAGTLDGDTGLDSIKHIFVGEKGDYYDIADGLPQHDKFSNV